LLFDLRFSRLLRFPIEVIPWRKSFMIELMTTIGITETLSLKLTEEELFPESDDEDITLMVMDSQDIEGAMEEFVGESAANAHELKLLTFLVFMLTSNLLAPSLRDG